MSVRTRVQRLERGPIGSAARCRLCGGDGKPALRVEWDPDIPRRPGDPPPPPSCAPEPEGCAACGKLRLTRILLSYDDTPGPRRDPQ
jgi:hypothetical protein